MMAKHELANPLQAWIPPYIGITAAKVALAVFPQECKGDVRLFLETVQRGAAPNPRRTVRREIRLREFPAGRWSEVEFVVDTDAARRLAEVRLVLSGSAEAECRFHFADARIKRQDGSEYALLNRDFPDYLAGMKKPLAAAPAKNLPKRNQLQIGYPNNWHILYDAKHLPEIGRLMKQYLPEYDIVLSCAQTPEPELAAVLPQLPESIFDQCMALPYHLYVISTSGTDIEASRGMAYGTALVLIVIVLVVNLLANLLRNYFAKKVKMN